MTEVIIILTLSEVHGPDVNVLKRPPGSQNLLSPHVAVPAEIPEKLWDALIAGDELDALAQAAFELGRKFERGEYKTIVQ